MKRFYKILKYILPTAIIGLAPILLVSCSSNNKNNNIESLDPNPIEINQFLSNNSFNIKVYQAESRPPYYGTIFPWYIDVDSKNDVHWYLMTNAHVLLSALGKYKEEEGRSPAEGSGIYYEHITPVSDCITFTINNNNNNKSNSTTEIQVTESASYKPNFENKLIAKQAYIISDLKDTTDKGNDSWDLFSNSSGTYNLDLCLLELVFDKQYLIDNQLSVLIKNASYPYLNYIKNKSNLVNLLFNSNMNTIAAGWPNKVYKIQTYGINQAENSNNYFIGEEYVTTPQPYTNFRYWTSKYHYENVNNVTFGSSGSPVYNIKPNESIVDSNAFVPYGVYCLFNMVDEPEPNTSWYEQFIFAGNEQYPGYNIYENFTNYLNKYK